MVLNPNAVRSLEAASRHQTKLLPIKMIKLLNSLSQINSIISAFSILLEKKNDENG